MEEQWLLINYQELIKSILDGNRTIQEPISIANRRRDTTSSVSFLNHLLSYQNIHKDNILEVLAGIYGKFLNRIDGTVVFHPLSREHMSYIVDLNLEDVSAGLIEKGINLEVTDRAKDWLGENGYDASFGARPVRRLIQDQVEDKLSDAILDGSLNPGDTAAVDLNDDGDIFVKAESPLPAASV